MIYCYIIVFNIISILVITVIIKVIIIVISSFAFLYQGWTMVYKAVAGLDQNAYQAYNSDQTLSEKEENALNVTNEHKNHYKNRIILNWDVFDPSEVI